MSSPRLHAPDINVPSLHTAVEKHLNFSMGIDAGISARSPNGPHPSDLTIPSVLLF